MSGRASLLFLLAAALIGWVETGRIRRAWGLHRKALENYRRAEELASRLPSLEAQAREISRRIEALASSLPSQQQLSPYLRELLRQASASGIQLIAIQPGEPRDRAGYRELPVDIKITASHHQAGKFLNRIETSGKFLRLEQVEMRPDAENLPSIEAYVKMTAYILPEKGAP